MSEVTAEPAPFPSQYASQYASPYAKQFADQFHDAMSEISSLTASSSEGAATEPASVRGDADAAAGLRLEAEDECGELYSRPFPSRSTKRFSSLSMASSIAAIMPFISAAEPKAVGFRTPAERDRPGRAALPADLNRPLPAYNRRRLHGSTPQLAQLLHLAAANAHCLPAPSFSAQAVDEWAQSLAQSFDTDGLSSAITLQYPAAEAPSPSPSPPAAAAARPARPHDAASKWRLRPLSTWGKSMLNASWTGDVAAGGAAAPTDASSPSSVSLLSDSGAASSTAAASTATSAQEDAARGAHSARSAHATGGGRASRASRVPAAWTASKRMSRAHLRQSRFWQLVRPTDGDAEPVLAALDEVSELSLEPRASEHEQGKQEVQDEEPRRSEASEEPPRSEAREKRAAPSPPRKRSRLRKLWKTLVPSNAFTGMRLS